MVRTGILLLVLSGGRPTGLVLAVLVVAVVTGARYLAWARFTYQLDDRSLVTEGGILNRTRRVVPLDRIQQVDLQRKLRHQVLGLAVVRIDTAGAGSEPEVTLDAVSGAEAERLRTVLTDHPAPGPTDPAVGPAPGPVAPGAMAGPSTAREPEHEVLTIGARRLALGGITGSKLAVVFVALGAVIGLIDDLPGGLREEASDSLAQGRRLGATAVVLVAVLALPIVVATAAGAAVLADGGYRLTRRGDLLQVRRGLLDQRQASLAVHRVQVVRIHQNPLRRLLGLMSVTLQSAGGSGQVEQQDARVRVPVLSTRELDALLAEVLPDAPRLPRLQPAPGAARRRAWVRRVVPALLVGGTVAALFPPVGLVALLLVPLAAVGGELAYRGLGWAAVDEHLVARRGGLSWETALVPMAKVQSTRLMSSPLQRRAGLATLRIDVAGRGQTPALLDAAAGDMVRLHRRTGETSAARRDERAVRRQVAASADPGEGR